MKRRVAAVLLTTVLVVGQSAPVFAAEQKLRSRSPSFVEFVGKLSKQVKKILNPSSAEDMTPPKPCTTNCP